MRLYYSIGIYVLSPLIFEYLFLDNEYKESIMATLLKMGSILVAG
ncbi:hypothetical protein IIE_05261 [Bacillus cereus VD045]|nr:hypothetical protein IIE_05261 [Bacillus cereus VD045]